MHTQTFKTDEFVYLTSKEDTKGPNKTVLVRKVEKWRWNLKGALENPAGGKIQYLMK